MKKDLIKQLIAYKKKTDKSDEAMARELNVSSFTVYRWRNRIRKPTGIYRTVLEDYLNGRD